ncbi:MAG: metal-sulfur cluster assembly factor [Pseudomonadota bacterium]
MTDLSQNETTGLHESDVREALIAVEDPELGYSIVELGLVRDIEVDGPAHRVKVWLTLTSPMCPMGPEIIHNTGLAVRSLQGVDDVEVELTWVPPWDPRKDCSDDIKAELGIWD